MYVLSIVSSYARVRPYHPRGLDRFDGKLVNGGRLYFVSNGTRYWIANPDTFQEGMGLDWNDILYASEEEVNSLQSGPALNMYAGDFKNLTRKIGFEVYRAKV